MRRKEAGASDREYDGYRERDPRGQEGRERWQHRLMGNHNGLAMVNKVRFNVHVVLLVLIARFVLGSGVLFSGWWCGVNVVAGDCCCSCGVCFLAAVSLLGDVMFSLVVLLLRVVV